MQYIWEAGKSRRVMHIQKHTIAGQPLMAALCNISHAFNRTINAPWGLGRRICINCRNRIPPMTTEDT